MDSSNVQKLYTKRASFYHFLFLDVLGIHAKIKNILRSSDVVCSGAKILDAGCGTGNVTRALSAIALERQINTITFHAFDLTQKMLELFREWINAVHAQNITLRQANVLHLEQLPSDWKDYDTIVSSGMLEYVPKEQLREVLRDLRSLLKPGGNIVVFITKKTFITKWLVGFWWKAHLSTEEELEQVFRDAGYQAVTIRQPWKNAFVVVEAKQEMSSISS